MSSSLLISSKDRLQDHLLRTSFRQIEDWANTRTWQNLIFNTGWGNTGGTFQTGQFWLDGFNTVWLRGVIRTTAAIAASTSSVIANLPVSLAPPMREIIADYGNAVVTTLPRIDIVPSATGAALTFLTGSGGGVGSNASFTLTGLSWKLGK